MSPIETRRFFVFAAAAVDDHKDLFRCLNVSWENDVKLM